MFARNHNTLTTIEGFIAGMASRTVIKSIFFLIGLWPLLSTADAVLFQRVDTAPIEHQYSGGWEHFVGGGISSFDCDGDDYPELYLAGGSAPATLIRNRSASFNGSLHFDAQTPESLAITHVTGSYPLDIDSDGILDLVILRVGKNRLLRGEGECRFSPFPESLGFVSEERWTTAFSASWENNQRLPTLAFGNYVDRDNPEGPFQACDDNRLYRPQHDHYVQALKLSPGYCALSMLFSDWGRRGRMDLRISNDRHYYVRNGSEQLWAMEAQPRLYGAQDGWIDYSLWGMGIASRDLSGDGIPEIFLTSMGDQKLQSLDRSVIGPKYLNATFDRGITAHRPFTGDDGRPSTGWHAEFADVNNDGRDDIFIAKGNVEQMLNSAILDPNNLLIQNSTGKFEEQALSAGVASVAKSRGATLADLNLDGLPDLAVLNRNSAPEIYQNISKPQGRWLLVKFIQAGTNTDAIGAWVEVQANDTSWFREITIGGGHAGGASGYQHFGLGTAKSVSLRVTWPDTVVSDWITLQTNNKIRLSRSSSGSLTVLNEQPLNH